MPIRDAGYDIKLSLMPKSIGLLIIVSTGLGNVSQVKKKFSIIDEHMKFRLLKKSFVNNQLNI